MLVATDLTKRFGTTTAVDHVSLEIARGEILCLLGPSGCGKTTLLRLLAGLERPDKGTLWLEGASLDDVPPHQRGFGMMFQDYALFPHQNVGQNIRFGLRLRGDSEAEQARRTADMLELVELAGYETRAVDELSGGERQRVALARSLATSPQLLLLDEPLGALDRALREQLMVALRRILKEVGVTAVAVTHDQTEAYALADRIAVMQAGRLVQVDAPAMLYNQPRTPFVARFLGFENVLAGEKTVVAGREMIATAVGLLPAPPHLALPEGVFQVLVRPTAAEILPSVDPSAQVDGWWQGEVVSVSFRGRFYVVGVRVAGVVLQFELAEDVGDTAVVLLRIDPAGLQVLGD